MTTVTDLNDVDVEVVEDEDEDAVVGGTAGGGGGESVAPTWPRLDELRNSVVARLLMDNRLPRHHTAACTSTTRRPPVGSDVVRGPRTLPPPVDLSAGKSKLDGEEDCRPTRSKSDVIDTRPPGDSDVTSASGRPQPLHQKLPPQPVDLSTILSDCRLGNRWLDLCSRLSVSPSTASLHRSSAAESNQHRYLPQYQARKSSTANVCDIPAPEGSRTTEERSVGSGSGSSQVLPALRRLLLKPLVEPSRTQPHKTVRGPSPAKSSSKIARYSSDSPPTLKPEPLSTEPKIKQEVVAADNQHNGSDIPDRLKTASGFRHAPEVHESRPPRKRRPEAHAFSDSTSGHDAEKATGLTNSGSNGKCPPQNGMPSEPEVERCPSDLSAAPPDIAGERSPSVEITQRSEGVAVYRQAADCFAHAPRKRFRYEYMSYVDNGTITNGHDTAAAASVDIGQTGSGNDVINLTTSTRAGSYREKTRDVAVQCVLAAEDDEGSEELTALGFSDPRRAIYRQQPPTCGCSTSAAGNLASFYCWYCGIAFDDDVLHAIHMGCHSVADKFVCNVCGLACGDRYGFNSHLVRGHVQATAVSEQPGPGSVLSLQLPGTARLVPQTVSLPFSSRPASLAADSRCCTAYERC